MKNFPILLGLWVAFAGTARASLPIITASPTNQTIKPSNNVTFLVVSPNATSYQWRFNGVDIPWGTNSSLVLTNAQATNSGYYLAVAKNETGWSPSQMAYLSVVWSNGILPLYNTNIAGAQANYSYAPCFGQYAGQPITNGTARLFAGPELDQLAFIGSTGPVRDGYFGSASVTKLIPTVPPGSKCYCRIDINYTPPCGGASVTQPSAIFSVTAGGNSLPVQAPRPYELTFPFYIEWPNFDSTGLYAPTSRVGVVGETMALYGSYYTSSGQPLPLNWRKDGRELPGATNSGGFPATTLTLTNLTENDCGVYDFVGPGADGITRDKILLSIQTASGSGVLKTPRVIGSNFVCDIEGAASRQYTILSSTNLLNWTSNLTVAIGASTNTANFSTPAGAAQARFYRATLVPIPIY